MEDPEKICICLKK